MKKSLFLLLALFSLSHAAITLKTVTFDDYEENASNYFLMYYPRQSLLDLGLTTTVAGYAITCRNNGTPGLSCFSSLGAATNDLIRIREQSHLIDWNVYTDSLGLKLDQTNFLYGLSGVLIGFIFMYSFILIVQRKG